LNCELGDAMMGPMSGPDASVLEGARALLRAPCVDDVERLVAFQRDNRKRFAALEGDRPEEFFSAAWWAGRVARLEEGARAGRLVYLLVFAKAEPTRVAGVISLPNISRAPFYSSDIGFAVDEKYEGSGLMREALEVTIGDAFARRCLHRLTAEYATSNARSARLLARLGFREEGRRRSYARVAGGWEDFVITALINERWREPAAI
jgi:ribosomal-protein-alanine N-acetyltransferase